MDPARSEIKNRRLRIQLVRAAADAIEAPSSPIHPVRRTDRPRFFITFPPTAVYEITSADDVNILFFSARLIAERPRGRPIGTGRWKFM